jgi:hypothetical protein
MSQNKIFPTYESYKEKPKSKLLADTFRLYQPYGFYVNEETKKAYAFNREYKSLHSPHIFAIASKIPKDSYKQIWLYDDGSQPWLNKKNYDKYIIELKALRDKYEIVYL